MRLIVLNVVFFTCLLFNNVYGQDNCAICNAVLQNGVFNEHEQKYQKAFQNDVDELFRHDYSHWSTMDEIKASSLGVAGSYSIFSASFKSASSEEEKKAEFSRLQDEYSKNSLQKEFIISSLTQKTASSDILNAWKDCIKNNCPNYQKMTWEVIGGPKEYIITVTYTPKSGTDPDSIFVNSITVVPTNTQIVGGNLKSLLKIKKFESASLIIKREEIEEDINLSISASSFGSITIPIKGISQQAIVASEQNTYDGLPIGTIISSLLDFESFSRIVGQPYTFEPSNSKCKWAPADDRHIEGSIYAKITGKNQLPDLRGVFLRGLNSFTQLQPEKPADREYDPDNTRVAGNFQPSDIKTHKHEIGQSTIVKTNHAIQGYPGGLAAGPYFSSSDSFVLIDAKANTGGTTDTKGQQTAPINVAVYYYIKIN